MEAIRLVLKFLVTISLGSAYPLCLTLDHQVIYRYSPKEIRAIFENKFHAFYWLPCGKIKYLCTIHVLRVNPRELLPAGSILRLGGHHAGGADEPSLKG